MQVYPRFDSRPGGPDDEDQWDHEKQRGTLGRWLVLITLYSIVLKAAQKAQSHKVVDAGGNTHVVKRLGWYGQLTSMRL